jgi:hypothetical protein
MTGDIKVNSMETMVYAVSGTGRNSSEIRTIHTTLYDLIAALSAACGPDEEDVLMATVVQLLNMQRVTCTGSLQGYRLRVLNSGGHTAIHSDGTRKGQRARRSEDSQTGVVSVHPVSL